MTPRVKRGLCLLPFIGLLWLTETIPLAVTALLVPVAAVALGFPALPTDKPLAPFVDPIVFLFLGGFALGLRLCQLQKARGPGA